MFLATDSEGFRPGAFALDANKDVILHCKVRYFNGQPIIKIDDYCSLHYIDRQYNTNSNDDPLKEVLLSNTMLPTCILELINYLCRIYNGHNYIDLCNSNDLDLNINGVEYHVFNNDITKLEFGSQDTDIAEHVLAPNKFVYTSLDDLNHIPIYGYYNGYRFMHIYVLLSTLYHSQFNKANSIKHLREYIPDVPKYFTNETAIVYKQLKRHEAINQKYLMLLNIYLDKLAEHDKNKAVLSMIEHILYKLYKHNHKD